jgi:hypothetical protein
VKAISPGRATWPVSEPPRCMAAIFRAPRPPYVFLPAPVLAPGFQSGSWALSNPRGLCAGRVKLVVLCGEHLVANAVEKLRTSAPADRGRSTSARSFASLDESGRRRRLHRDVVQGSSSSAAMMMRNYVDNCIGVICDANCCSWRILTLVELCLAVVKADVGCLLTASAHRR